MAFDGCYDLCREKAERYNLDLSKPGDKEFYCSPCPICGTCKQYQCECKAKEN